MKIRFLIDENLSPRLKTTILRLNPSIDILRVGDINTPHLGTLDPDILNYLELSQRMLVTDNRASMPDHLSAYWSSGKQTWGLLWVRPNTPLRELAQTLLLIWEASEAEEWINRLDWIPF